MSAEERGEGKPHWLKIGFNMVGKRQVMDIEVRFLPWLYSATTAANNVLRIGLPDCDAGVKGGLWTLKRQYHEVRIPWLFMSPSY